MQAATRLPLRAMAMGLPQRLPARMAARAISSTTQKPADVAPIVGTGPPPAPPSTNGQDYQGPRNSEDPIARVQRRRRQAELLKNAKELKNAAQAGPSAGMKRRFWKDVTVKEVDGDLEVHLDARPLRHPVTKAIVRIPATKKHLASALAIEWDHLVSAQQATRQHLIPLTSLVCRALDIEADDAAAAKGGARDADAPVPFSSTGGEGDATIRSQIATTLLRYLDTDSLLCWAPPAGEFDPVNEAGESLRQVQERISNEVTGFMAQHVWKGHELVPVLDEGSIMPRKQSAGAREAVKVWIESLGPWELAGLERGALAGKSLVTASRLVAAWSEHGAGVRVDGEVFGVEEAARATSLEVSWQTGRWGEVEDTHDVEKEDLKRQMGSVVLLVSGVKA
ncbi:ATP12 protein [Plectosphaerella plurivora]|uniref:ATP12 protein n=1 Tax=Plectosphaerella plurivora TaxID=936078 RepID=A0A9P9AGG2_9PEZI|nr:ATP12 protein [Plectosphaerella plurivora]